MKTRSVRMMISVFVAACVLSLPAHAELGLGSIFSSQGLRAVGLAVKSAVESLYASDKTPAEVESEIIAIVNEAVSTGNEQVVQYTIVAVMMGGGGDNLKASRAAINNSQAFGAFPSLVAFTAAQAGSLISSGGSDPASGGEQAGGGEAEEQGGMQSSDEQGGSGEDPTTLGGGDPNPFDPGADGGDIDDDDSSATPV